MINLQPLLNSKDATSSKVKKQYSPSSLAINPNNQKIYVANYNDNSMSVIDGTKQKNKLILTMPVGQKPSSIGVEFE